jgi:twitching motility two-component system response regulator PilG
VTAGVPSGGSGSSGPERARAPGRPGRKVLLVDDTRTLLSLIQVYLAGWELEFHEARDGQEGLARARQILPDLIVTDVRMPGMDGFDLCAAVRADPGLRRTPVVLLTALDDDASRGKGRQVGASAFLVKPVSAAELRRTVGSFLELSPGG